jgi:AraC-like DNA-binding protein
MASNGISGSDDHNAAVAGQRRFALLQGALARTPFSVSDAESGMFEEVRWRDPGMVASDLAGGSDVRISRWTAAFGEPRNERAVTPDRCHIVTVALRASRLSLSANSRLLFEGSMLPGTVHVSKPGEELVARFVPPFDFLHLHIDNDFLYEAGLISDEDGTGSACSGEAPLFRDSLVEALGRSLLDHPGDPCGPHYVRSVGKAIVMRAMARQQNERRCRALPKWRMKRLEQYLTANIDRPVSLQDMASVAGLSRMHFAAQFRAATGFRPHEYLLLKRVEQAKAAMTETTMPLVEIAFSVGFNAQAHFSTVFKRFTGKSPAQWKQEFQSARQA